MDSLLRRRDELSEEANRLNKPTILIAKSNRQICDRAQKDTHCVVQKGDVVRGVQCLLLAISSKSLFQIPDQLY
jgi:hypothetical protein